MASQHGLPLVERYLLNAADAAMEKEDDLKRKKKTAQEDIHRLGIEVLPPPNRQAYHHPEKPSRKGKIVVSTPVERIQSTPLLTPPLSPVSSRNPIESVLSFTETTNGEIPREEVSQLRTAIANHQSQIQSLTLEHKKALDEVQLLREKRSKASTDNVSAIREDRDDEIERYRKREERLAQVIREKDQRIVDLEKSLYESEKTGRGLRRQLAEAEERAEAIDHTIKHVSQEQSSARENKKKPHISRDLKVRKNSWEFRRRPGSRETPLKAAYHIIAKGGISETRTSG